MIIPLPQSVKAYYLVDRPRGDFVSDSTEFSAMLMDGVFEGNDLLSCPLLVGIRCLVLLPL